MRRILIFTVVSSALLLLSFNFIADGSGGKLPSVLVKDINGNTINTSSFNNHGKPMVISFWATWCSPCRKELNNIAEKYDTWVKETGVKVIAISIDDSRSSHQVKPVVDAASWDYEIYLDENSDFKRAMNVQNPPFTFLLNGKGEVVYSHSGYLPGDENELYEKIKALKDSVQ
jgi:cytochrome c biogenesis protein CcmG/thiol:disulfide interchange protein DsbE